MPITQRAKRGVLHDKKGDSVLYPKIQHTHNMGMFQASNCLCFLQKRLDSIVLDIRMQHFNGGMRLEIAVLSQVDSSKSTPPKLSQQLIVPNLLPGKGGCLFLVWLSASSEVSIRSATSSA